MNSLLLPHALTGESPVRACSSGVLLPLVGARHALNEDGLALISRAQLPGVEGHLLGTALWTCLLDLHARHECEQSCKVRPSCHVCQH